MTVFRMLCVTLGAGLLMMLAQSGHAQKKGARAKADPNSVVFYRCVDRQGMVSLQNDVPCAKGQKQTKQVMQKPAAPTYTVAPETYPPAPAVAPPVAPVPQPVTQPAPIARTTLPPPPIYRCYTPQQKSYLSDNGAPKARCIPLMPSNADPNDPNTPKMCDMQQDTCERIPDQDACASWQQYDLEAKALVEMGNPEFINDAIALSTRTGKVMAQSTCASPAQNP